MPEQAANGAPAKPDFDCLIVGAGFGGIYLLHRLRKLGYSCRIYEAGSDLGGVWNTSRYPGARVDTPIPVYEFSFEEVWKDWTWTETYPDAQEIRNYFQHVENVLHIKQYVDFNKRVIGAQYDVSSHRWIVRVQDGTTTTSRFFLVCAGFAAKTFVPDFQGLDKFKGEVHHSSSWPEQGIDVRGKRVGIIGTGSSGVQIIQEWGKSAKSTVVFQRTPNLALPMRQNKTSAEDQNKRKPGYPEFFEKRQRTYGGQPVEPWSKNVFDDTPQDREAFFERRWQEGGFGFWIANYRDLYTDLKANREAYDFWARKTRGRLQDPVKRDMVAPLEPPHPFGTKRPSLELDYFDVLDSPSVQVVDVKKNKIVQVLPDGIRTEDGSFFAVDAIALATGYDAITGSMTNMGLRNVDGVPLAEEWKGGASSYLGMTRKGYPNMFFVYSVHAPTAFSNGPSCVETQGSWIVDAIVKIDGSGLRYIEPTPEAEKEWKDKVNALSDRTLHPLTDSWYMGANIPGKPREQLNYLGGLDFYERECRMTLEDWHGFITV
ncbi:Cyclohexanone 1,2-monooxygenase [Colletotrichum sp. SAR 10_70]|nr:Cyclohexanone 1,2-monooxygenase [Colletotrichum sp. SAR 10_71]KAI8158400.1 Cyclohexanone 1,2-monooxygenase [Colletotrichum sp. SAR 10_70]KAI8174927.1 Cyclohexanone 1,2-monooxygenase [Colletotrichum sp. SAR 10_75]KAI8219973.1 Cyclohexanone 1,2-monooxygenase [Colletotrichum sp. SAR 10_77]